MDCAVSDAWYWRAKLVKDGPWIGVKTWRGPPLIEGEEVDRSPRWQCLVRNETTGRAILYGEPCPIEVDGIGLRSVERIDEAEYRYLIDHSQWATAHAPHLPDAAPRVKINKRGTSVF
jgi:hypothetical protein